jgi:hypothetical protein
VPTYLLLGRHGRDLEAPSARGGGREASRLGEPRRRAAAGGDRCWYRGHFFLLFFFPAAATQSVSQLCVFCFPGLLALCFNVRRNRRNLNVATGRGGLSFGWTHVGRTERNRATSMCGLVATLPAGQPGGHALPQMQPLYHSQAR